MTPLLEGLRVLDLTRVLAGPYCTMLLGDLGADVIKVERTKIGDDTRRWGPPFTEAGQSAYFLCVNRNKRSLTLNLKSDRGQSILHELITQADVLIENFKVGTLERWGLDYPTLETLRPGLVYCTITGFGYTGPYQNQSGYDFPIQALGGVMSVTGPPNGAPYKVGVAIVDITAGLFAANAILASLLHREGTGDGQRVDIALLDVQVAWLANVASNYLVSGEVPQRYGNAHPNIVPYQIFQAQDDQFALGVGNDEQWQKLCEIISHPEWTTDTRFVTNRARVKNRGALIPMLERLFETHSVSHWLSIANEIGIAAAPVNTIDRVFADPQVQARGLQIEIPHPLQGTIPMTASPLHIPTSPTVVKYPPPLLGEHTYEVLQETLGYSPELIEQLTKDQVI